MRSPALSLALAAAIAVGTATPAVADHGGGPSSRDVAAGRAVVSQREAEVAAAAKAVAHAQAVVDRLGTAAEMAVESFNAARLREQAAHRDERVAQVVLADA